MIWRMAEAGRLAAETSRPGQPAIARDKIENYNAFKMFRGTVPPAYSGPPRARAWLYPRSLAVLSPTPQPEKGPVIRGPPPWPLLFALVKTPRRYPSFHL